jgi:N-acetylglucosamine-6-phosphate deacetylase
MKESFYAIIAGNVYAEEGILKNGAVIVRDGRIAGITDWPQELGVQTVYDFSEYELIPGLIDTHIHGANGYDVMMADFTAINEISKYLAQKGITAFLPATVTEELQRIKAALINIKDAMGRVEGAQILGAYIEGPYFTEKHRGAHPAALLREIRLEEMKELVAAAPAQVRTVAIAPEKRESDGLIRYLKRMGIHTALGHTDATYEEVQRAVSAGADIAVHTFNGMRGFHHREPGTVGAVLTNDEVYTELIADFIHAHPAAIEILLRCKSPDKVVLISDAMQAAGLADGEYTLGTLKVIVRNGVARTESGSLAGSSTNIARCVRDLIVNLQVDPLRAVHMASLNPSKLLGAEPDLGSIRVGKQADLVLVDKEFEAVMTLVKGKVVYRKNKSGGRTVK